MPNTVEETQALNVSTVGKNFGMTVIQTIIGMFQKHFAQSVILNVHPIMSRVSHLQSILKRYKMKSYFQKMFPHIKFAVWFGFYFLGLFFISEYIATTTIAKLVTIALWAFGYPYSKGLSK